ncbi:MAG: hypothetical protein RL333_235 [Pseudomonadota bacterium]
MSEPSPTPIELNPPEPPRRVAPEEAEGLVRLKPETLLDLDQRVEQFLKAILTDPLGSEGFKSRVEGVHSLAHDDIRAAAQISNRLLEQPARSLKGGLMDESSSVSSSLLELRKTLEDLDPARQGDLLAPKRLLGLIPMGNRLKDYFLRFESAQSHLDAILKSLYDGQDELRKDNAAIEEEKIQAWAIMERLEQYIYIGRRIDTALEAQLSEIDRTDPEKARVVREELLFYIRQKVQDLLTQLAVTVQGYLAMDMIRKNNLELIKGVDRTATTTLSALRTAVIVAQALANQRLVLEQVSALNSRTSELIASTAEMMKTQAGAIHEKAANATLDLKQLRGAFTQIYATLDLMADYKIKALANMQTTVDALTQDVEMARGHLDRVRGSEGGESRVQSTETPNPELKL